MHFSDVWHLNRYKQMIQYSENKYIFYEFIFSILQFWNGSSTTNPHALSHLNVFFCCLCRNRKNLLRLRHHLKSLSRTLLRDWAYLLRDPPPNLSLQIQPIRSESMITLISSPSMAFLQRTMQKQTSRRKVTHRDSTRVSTATSMWCVNTVVLHSHCQHPLFTNCMCLDHLGRWDPAVWSFRVNQMEREIPEIALRTPPFPTTAAMASGDSCPSPVSGQLNTTFIQSLIL